MERYTPLKVPDDAYSASGWNGNTEVPTKNAFRDVVEAIDGVLPAIFFNYGDATPAILYTPDADQVIASVRLVVVIAFDGAGAKVSIGTAASPELLMDEDDSLLSAVSSFETNPGETVTSGTEIKAFITPGAGASQGRCMILIEYAKG